MTDARSLFASLYHPPADSAEGGVVFTDRICLNSLTGAADAFLALTLAGDAAIPRLVLAVTDGIPEADRLADDLRLVAGLGPESTRILEFPPPLGDDRDAIGVRLKTLAAVRAWELNPGPAVIVAAYPALVAPVPRGNVPALHLAPTRTEGPGLSSIVERLAAMGYERMAQVEKPGDFSVRGGIVDAWSPGEEFPIRGEFFGDELESLRSFNPGSQLSIARLDECLLMPANDRAAGAGDAGCTTLAALLPAKATVLALEHNAYDLKSVVDLDHAPHVVYTGEPAPEGVARYPFPTVPLPGFAELGAEAAHHPELFDAARHRLESHLKAARERGDEVIRLDALSGGFEIGGEDGKPGLVVVTKADRVFTKRKPRTPRPRSEGRRLNDFEDLEPGEYVVHVDHGVGRYTGSSEIVVDGRRTEVFTIEYADGAKLHVPANHAHLLTRYVGIKGEEVRLHRLDGKRWREDRAAAQRAVADLAVSLLETQARREVAPGFAYDVDCEGRDAFEAAFPYEETPDQTAAIAAVMQDLARPRPMDRLLCGDAGYGKTEVAMRAAFVAAMNGRQVALLAPTTVLAEQHFETFTSRFDGTPVRIESLSRFQNQLTHRGTLERLASGVCDIVIGTHAILSERTVFHDLGLIIIDEEQRFGVRHKEFLKRLRSTSDVLTLSATPIPRTLYLSMTGARDLSLLRSPPRERVAVETKIVTDSDPVVRAAIDAELARGGQVFFLHNRVATIGRVEKRLREICPEARVVVAHGQMDAHTLARKMRDFGRGEYDILLSTTIVESGIDIPRANTILIDHAESFGLADLYQLRGRVGRSAKAGHAIFLLPPGGVDSDARERLKALQRHGGLGSGFNLAVRDLELRGAGNLLGAQQSGHIAAVGFGLYCQLLKRTVAALKGEALPEIVEVAFKFDFLDLSPASEDPDAAAAIPYGYIEEDAQRMSLLKRFAEAGEHREVAALTAELKDRFGPLPPPVRRFVRLSELRLAAAKAKITAIDVQGARAILYRGNREIAKVVELRSRTPDRKLAELMKAVRRP